MYWKDFLLRDDIAANLSQDEELPRYPYPLKQAGNMLVAEGRGIVFMPDAGCTGTFNAEFGSGSWKDGSMLHNGWRFDITVGPGETKEITYRLP